MRRLYIYILAFWTVLGMGGCTLNDSYNLVPSSDLPFISYSIKLTSPLVRFDSLSYTIVEKKGKMWFASFDASGDVNYLHDVSGLFGNRFDLKTLSGIKYFRLGNYFYGLLLKDNALYPLRLFALDPHTGNVVDVHTPEFPQDSNIISSTFTAILPSTPHLSNLFVFQQYTDTMSVYHQQLIRYKCTNNEMTPLDSISLDTLGHIEIWNNFVIDASRLYFYVIANYGTDNTVYEYSYEQQDTSVSFTKLKSGFLPVAYVSMGNGYIFSSISTNENTFVPVIYSLREHDISAIISSDKFENFLITNKIQVNDTDYVIGYISKDAEGYVNYAKYGLINGDFMLIRYNQTDFLNSPNNLPMLYTVLPSFKNFVPYGILDNGQGLTIIGKGDAFSYFPATIILKTDYTGRPIKSTRNARH